jgi:putative FmdB family regulatory protein
MPLYDYQCKQCQAIFEVRASICEKEAGLAPICPTCESQQTQQLITSGLVLRSGAGQMRPGCGPSAGPGCCG